MNLLTDKTCSHHPDLKQLDHAEAQNWLTLIDSNWKIDPDRGLLSRQFEFENYYQTMAFTNAVAWIAHQQDHHPEITVCYRHCNLDYTTHAVKGLSLNDFICAAQVDALKPIA